MTKTLEAAIRRAQAMAPDFAGEIDQALRAADFSKPLFYVESEDRLTMLKAIWPVVPRSVRPGSMAKAISSGDAPSRELMFICRAIRQIRASGALVVESLDDQAFHDGLPQVVTAYRGTTQAELEDVPFFGVCWTTERARAEWFATQHGRFRRLDSSPIMLVQEIDRAEVAGAANGRAEHEIFIDSATTFSTWKAGKLTVEQLDASSKVPRPDR